MFGKSRFSFGGIVLSFVAGALAGAAIGFLYAPMTGRKMQKKVANLTDKVLDKVDDLQGTVRRMAA